MVFEDFSERAPHRSVGLEVEGKTFWVAREALAEFSSVFKTMFYGEGDYKVKAKDIIQLPNKSADEILEFLRCLFLFKEIDEENVDILVKLCDEYDVKYLMGNCKKFLVERVGPLKEMCVSRGQKEIIKLFQTGVQYKLKDFVRSTLPAVARYGFTVFQPFYDQLPIEVQKAIFLQMTSQEIEHKRYCNSKWYCGSKGRHDNIATCCDCHKPTVFAFETDEIESNRCQCVKTSASLELEKIGL